MLFTQMCQISKCQSVPNSFPLSVPDSYSHPQMSFSPHAGTIQSKKASGVMRQHCFPSEGCLRNASDEYQADPTSAVWPQMPECDSRDEEEEEEGRRRCGGRTGRARSQPYLPWLLLRKAFPEAAIWLAAGSVDRQIH